MEVEIQEILTAFAWILLCCLGRNPLRMRRSAGGTFKGSSQRVERNLMGFNQGSCRIILHLGRNSCVYQYHLGLSCWKGVLHPGMDLEVLVDKQLTNGWLSVDPRLVSGVSLWPRSLMAQSGASRLGRCSSPLLCPGDATSGALHPVLGSPVLGRLGTAGGSPLEGRDWNPGSSI